jgi:hypothetical protein
MPKNVVATVSAPALSVAEITARLANLVATDPAVAQAIALQSLTRGTRVATARKGNAATETEAERANRCAQFDDYSARGKIVAFAIAELGNKGKVALTEDAIATAIGLPVYKVRPALAIVEARLSDLHNAKFPLVSQIGYVASVEGERNEAKLLHFARVAPAPVRKGKAAKGKSVATVAPAPAPVSEGEKGE